ncbi:MAG: ABC transporter substrate-binding protein [Holosporales bacterium]|jgi:polar amino acid transport system substrate-binding protein|nr:ABC transporter substrate-binding protein [Holosporales bacterium]
MSRIFNIFISILSIYVLSGCEDEKKQDDVIVFGTSADYPPFEYISNGKIVGFDIDLATEIAKKMGKKAKIENLSFGIMFISMQNKTVDALISSLGKTSERVKTYDFSNQYYKETASIIYKKENTIQNAEQMRSKKIVVQLGSIPEKWVRAKTKADVIPMDNMNGAVEALKAGQVEGVMMNTIAAKSFVEKNEGLSCCVINEYTENEGYAIAFPKDSPLTQEVNNILKEMEENGELHKLRSKWSLND